MENLPSNWFYDQAEKETATFLKGRCHSLSTSKRNVPRYVSSANCIFLFLRISDISHKLIANQIWEFCSSYDKQLIHGWTLSSPMY